VVYLFSKEEEKQKCFGNYFSIEYENFFAKYAINVTQGTPISANL